MATGPARSRPTERSDTDLVAAAVAGDRQALDELLRRHHARLYAICRRLAGNDADAADATQEALLAIVRGLPRFDGRSSFATWSYRVATNACLDELRRRQRRPVPGLEARAEPTASGAEQQVDDRLLLDRVLPLVDEDFRVAVVLRDVAGLDYAQIAEVLGIPPGTVRSRISRGRRQLASLLGNHEDRP